MDAVDWGGGKLDEEEANNPDIEDCELIDESWNIERDVLQASVSELVQTEGYGNTNSLEAGLVEDRLSAAERVDQHVLDAAVSVLQLASQDSSSPGFAEATVLADTVANQVAADCGHLRPRASALLKACPTTCDVLAQLQKTIDIWAGALPEHGGTMSLMQVREGRILEIVTWQPGNRQGKRVPVEGDKWRYILGGSAFGNVEARRIHDLSSAGVVLPDIGIRMDKPKVYREPIPGGVLHLKHVWEAGMSARCEIQICLTPCMQCHQSDAFRCIVCLLPWHHCGAQAVPAAVMDNTNITYWWELCSRLPPAVRYPKGLLVAESLLSSMCCLCASTVNIN